MRFGHSRPLAVRNLNQLPKQNLVVLIDLYVAFSRIKSVRTLLLLLKMLNLLNKMFDLGRWRHGGFEVVFVGCDLMQLHLVQFLLTWVI